MGVSGSGKSTVGALLAAHLSWEFLDADEFHPAANVAKMSAGTPLEDADRWPWLERLNEELRQRTNAVLACSALKDSYRQVLCKDLDCRIVHLRGSYDLLRARLQERKHRYMPASLLESQFAALEPPAGAIDIDVARPAEECVADVIAVLAGQGAGTRCHSNP